MKVLVLYDYPPTAGGLATQGELLYRGLLSIGVDAKATHIQSAPEKEWYYRWFKPDAVVGVGFWGDYPDLVQHPQRFGMRAVPWLLADGYVANYREELDALPLILVTSNWVKQTYIRDGIRGDRIKVLPVGCNTDTFYPRDPKDPGVRAIREVLNVDPEQLLILTVGGDAASKGGREVIEALARIRNDVPDFRYVCKVWPQPRTTVQNALDAELVRSLGLEDRVMFSTYRLSRDLMPFLLSACDVYAAPSRLEGFGMPQVEAGACGKPVLGIRAMAMLDTLVDRETALLAGVATVNTVAETILGPESGYPPEHHVHFDPPRVADYRASVPDIATALHELLNSPALRQRLGEAARKRVVAQFDYRLVAKKLVAFLS